MTIASLKTGAIGALAGVVIGGLVAYNIGHSLGDSAGYKRAEMKAEKVITTKNATIKVQSGDLTQCRQANQNYHTAVGVQLERINAELMANLERQGLAEKKNAVADARMLDAARISADNSAKAREAIQNAAEECLRRGVSPEFVSMLNSILPGGVGSGVSAGGNPVPRQ